MVETSVGAPVLLYDGVCGFCNKSVQLILDHDRQGSMRFAALQGDYGQAVIGRHPELRGANSSTYAPTRRSRSPPTSAASGNSSSRRSSCRGPCATTFTTCSRATVI